jgi:hypothetical protein
MLFDRILHHQKERALVRTTDLVPLEPADLGAALVKTALPPLLESGLELSTVLLPLLPAAESERTCCIQC